MLISDVTNKIKDCEVRTRELLVWEDNGPIATGLLFAPRQYLMLSVGVTCQEETSCLLSLPLQRETTPLSGREPEAEVSGRTCRRRLFQCQLQFLKSGSYPLS